MIRQDIAVKNDRIKILAVEDNREHLAMIKAGVIAKCSGEAPKVDIETRVRLADAHYEIIHCYTIREAMNILDSFQPDLAILDINMTDSSHTGEEPGHMTSGLEFYRHLGATSQIKMERILFSSHFTTTQVYTSLFPEERKIIIPKGTEGTGYEMLATSIAGWLKKVAANIISSSPSATIQKIEEDLQTSGFDKISTYPYQFGARQMSLQQLLMFCAVIEKNPHAPGEFRLYWKDPAMEFMELVKQIPKNFEKDRSLWTRPFLKNALAYYQKNLAIQYESQIINETKNTVNQLFARADKIPQEKLKGSALKDFGTISFEDRTLDGCEHFLANFRNVLIIRRTLITLELFASKHIDNYHNPAIRTYVKKFLEKYVEETFQAIKSRSEGYKTRELTQFGNMLNFSFRDPGTGRSNGRINDSRQGLTSSYRIYEFEKTWFDSQDFTRLMDSLFASAGR